MTTGAWTELKMPETMNCIVVDDEKLIRELMVDNIARVPFLCLQAACRNAMEAVTALHAGGADLLFLDIRLPDLDGIRLLRSLAKPPLVILVTAYKDYAWEGFDLDVVDYLVKPFGFERFLKACNKAYRRFGGAAQERGPGEELPSRPDYFFVYVEYNRVRISLDDLLYIEGMKDYVKIFLASSPRPVITRLNLKAMEERLTGRRFVRCHKSYIVSADKITSVRRDLLVIGRVEIPLSDSYRASVEEMLSR